MDTIPFNLVYKSWLGTSEKVLSHIELGDVESAFYVPKDAYILDISNLKISDLLLVYNSTVFWNIELPDKFYEFCSNNEKEVIKITFPQMFKDVFIPKMIRSTFIKLNISFISREDLFCFPIRGEYEQRLNSYNKETECRISFVADGFETNFFTIFIYSGNGRNFFLNCSNSYLRRSCTSIINEINDIITSIRNGLDIEIFFKRKDRDQILFIDGKLTHDLKYIKINEFNKYNVIDIFIKLTDYLIKNI